MSVFTSTALRQKKKAKSADDSDFAFGLELILDGLERARDEGER